MMRAPPGGFLGGGNMLRSLTLSPLNSALQQAHQMAHRRLENGGPAAPENRRTDRNADSEFLVPQDIDLLRFAMAMEAKLASGRVPVPGLAIVALSALQMRPDGRVMVLPDYVQRLGRRFLDDVVAQIRAGRNAEHRRAPRPARLQQQPSRHLF